MMAKAQVSPDALYSAVLIDNVPETDIPHVRYTSGLFLYDEIFLGGRLMNRWWSSTGGIRPDMHYRFADWYKQTAPLLPADAFVLELEGQVLREDWRWLGAEETPDPSGFRGAGRPIRHVVAHLEHARRPVEVAVHTRLDGSPFMIRWLEVTNTSDRATAISGVSPWSGLVWSHRYSEHTPPGAPSPFEVAYTHRFQWGEEGDLWWVPLAPGVKVVDGGHRGRSGWGRPAFMLRNRDNGEMLWAELGWSGNWRFAIDTRLNANKDEASVTFYLGPDSADPALRVIDPGETVKTPVTHLALFHADMDTCVQAAHDHVRHVVMPAQLPGRNQLVQANHRGYICDRESQEGIQREIDIAAEVGVELYVIDAGWYGREPNQWWLNAGDWQTGSWIPGGMEAISAYAHGKGMLFGLWQEIEAIGQNTQLRDDHPDWVLTRDGEPVGAGGAKGRMLDLTRPQVVSWMEAEMIRVIRQFNLDHWRLDHNTTIEEGGNRVYQGFVENTLWRHCEQFYGILDRVRAQCPNVLFENCAGGGGRLDWEIMRRFQITEISDWLRAPRHLKILNGITHALPPEVCLLTFGTEQGGHVLDGDVNMQLRVVTMCHPILRGISPTLDELNPLYRARIVHALEVYKDFIRPIMPECRVFHHSGMLPLFDVTPWCVLEYAAADRSRAVVGVFRTGDIGEDTYLVRPQGLDLNCNYRVRFENLGQAAAFTGAELAQGGIRVRLPANLTSEMLLITA
jgi:alpha-galactosidase